MKESLNAKKILIADDNEDSVNILRAVLQQKGYEVTTARNGIEALEKVAIDPPDLILLDVMMPGKGGFEVCASVKSDARTKRIYVIMISAHSDLISKERGFNLGANDYLTKPIKPADVIERVAMLLDAPPLADAG